MGAGYGCRRWDIDSFFALLKGPATVDPEAGRRFAASVPQPGEGAIVDLLREEFSQDKDMLSA